MSIPVLTQLYDEVRRLSIAGSVVAAGDFRLKKLVAPLEQAGQKAPVFAKVAQAVTKLVESTDKTSADALLDLSTLINAILYTQGETGRAGQLQPIETTDLGQHGLGQQTQASARVLKPLLEALSTTGSGRLEIIKDAHERGAFRDLRLVKPALAALDDPYPEIGDFVADKVLALYGKAILPELRAKFDQKGRAGHVRRLVLMHRIDPEGTGPLVKEALDNGSKEMKLAAIECLGSWPERLRSLLKPVTYLVEQATAKAQEIRQAALRALSKISSRESVTTLQKALQGDDIDIAAPAIRDSQNPKLVSMAAAEAGSQLKALIANKNKKSLAAEVKRMLALLDCLDGSRDKETESLLLEVFQAREKLGKIKTDPSGFEVRANVAEMMAACTPKTQRALIERWDSLWVLEIECAFVAACRLLSPSEVFDRFAPCLDLNSKPKRKATDAPVEQSDAIYAVLRYARPLWDQDPGEVTSGRRISSEHLDPRWLDLAVAAGDVELVDALARPGHVGAERLLERAFFERLEKPRQGESGSLLLTMIAMRHPVATKAVIANIRKHATSRYCSFAYGAAQMIPDLPKEAVPELESMLPELPERLGKYVMDYIARLKDKV